jgi:hypothetical protein
MIGSKPTESEIFLANALGARFGVRDTSTVLNKDRLNEANPETYFLFLYGLFYAWIWIFILFGIMWALIGAALHYAELLSVSSIASVFEFGAVFVLVGAWDAVWRIFVIWPARSRYLRAGRTLDETEYRLMRRARLNDMTPLIQLAAGLVFVFHVWTRI